jgi:hypothetical protein
MLIITFLPNAARFALAVGYPISAFSAWPSAKRAGYSDTHIGFWF